MSLLTSHAIRLSLEHGRNPKSVMSLEPIGIQPHPQADCWNPTSIDLTLDDVFYRPDPRRLCQMYGEWIPEVARAIDMGQPRDALWADLATLMGPPLTKPTGLVLPPWCHALGETREKIWMPHWATGVVDGRSILGRFGLQVHLTACHIHPGWTGKLVLEFYNSGCVPLRLTPGMRVCSLYFHANA
jgi:dCTP deaminase